MNRPHSKSPARSPRPALLRSALALLALTALPSPSLGQAAVSLGPGTDRHQWSNVNLQGMGWVTGVCVHPLEADLVYVRTDVGGVFRYAPDRGAWIPLFDRFGWGITKPTLPSQDVESLALDPTDVHRVYAALGNDSESDIFRSDDRGRTWQALGLRGPGGATVPMFGNGIGRQTGERLAIDPNRPATIFFGSRFDGIFRSVDDGASWTRVLSPVPGTGPAGVTFLAVDPSSAGAAGSTRIYAGVDALGIYVSNDGGATWAREAGVGGNTPYQMAISSAGNAWVTFSIENETAVTNGGVWRYSKAIDQWENVSPAANLGFTGISVDPFVPGHVVAKPARLGFGVPTGIRESFNGGSTWSIRPASWNMPPYYTSETQIGWEYGTGAMLFDPSVQDRLWWVTGYAVFRSNDLSLPTPTFDALMEGLEELVVCDVDIHPTGRLMLPVWDMQGFVIDDPTAVPTETIRPDDFARGSAMVYAPSDPDRMYYAGIVQFTPEPRFGRSDDGGLSFTPITTLPYSFGIGDGEIAVSSTNPDRLVWSFPFNAFAFPFTSETWYSTDGAATWTQSSGYEGSLLANAGTTGRTLVADPIDGMRFYAFNCGPDNGYRTTFYTSTDGGATFAPTYEAYGGPPCNNGVTLEPEPGASGVLWLAIPQFEIDDAPLYRTIDGMATWTELAQVSGALLVSCGAPSPGRSNPAVYVFGVVNGKEGLFVSDDVSAMAGAASAATWRQLNPPRLGFQKITSLRADPNQYGRVLAGTDGRGAFLLEARPMRR